MSKVKQDKGYIVGFEIGKWYVFSEDDDEEYVKAKLIKITEKSFCFSFKDKDGNNKKRRIKRIDNDGNIIPHNRDSNTLKWGPTWYYLGKKKPLSGWCKKCDLCVYSKGFNTEEWNPSFEWC